MLTKLGQFKKLKYREWPQLCKLSQLCYNFLSSFENEEEKNYIHSNPPPIAVRNSLTNQFDQKKITFLYIFNNNKKVTRLYRDIHPGDSWPYIEYSFLLQNLFAARLLREFNFGIFLSKTHRYSRLTKLKDVFCLVPFFACLPRFLLNFLGRCTEPGYIVVTSSPVKRVIISSKKEPHRFSWKEASHSPP